MTENRYYRYLNFPFSVDLKLPEFADINHKVLTSEYIPGELVDFLTQHGCKIGFAEIFRKSPGYSHHLALHLDGHEFDDHVKINFVLNNNGSKMRWWKVKDPALLKKEITVVKTHYYYAAEEDCDLVAEAELDRPALVNAGQLHSIHSVVNENRYAFSFMIMRADGSRLLWDDAVELFKDYL